MRRFSQRQRLLFSLACTTPVYMFVCSEHLSKACSSLVPPWAALAHTAPTTECHFQTQEAEVVSSCLWKMGCCYWYESRPYFHPHYYSQFHCPVGVHADAEGSPCLGNFPSSSRSRIFRARVRRGSRGRGAGLQQSP